VTDLRPATAADLPALRHLFAGALHHEPVHRAALADLLYERPPADPSLRLVATEGDVIGAAFGAVHDGTGYVDAIAVTADRRRRGVGAALLGRLEERLGAAGARALRIGGNTAYYAWPGVDVRYTAALCLADRAGYRRTGTAENMTVPLADWVPGERVEPRDPAVTVRRASPGDPLLDFVGERFSGPWLREAGIALARPVPTVFVALRGERIVGFACHGVYRADWFGPVGVVDDERGSGVGEALLRRCLDDQAAAGMSTAQISWIGPAAFYARTVGAYCDRTFALFEK
jgi:predicted N-acetyltransferase YhbS